MVQRNLTPGGDKNGADINLALDALEMAFTHSHINAFVIVGGDSDFMALVEKLKQYDRKVFVVGGRAFTSTILQRNCTEFIAYENVVGVTSVRKPGVRGAKTEATIEKAVPLVRRALKVLADREVSPQLGVLKSTLLQLDSTFSEREYGASTFRDFVQRLARGGYVTLKGTDRNIYVELREGADGQPSSATSATTGTGRDGEPHVDGESLTSSGTMPLLDSETLTPVATESVNAPASSSAAHGHAASTMTQHGAAAHQAPHAHPQGAAPAPVAASAASSAPSTASSSSAPAASGAAPSASAAATSTGQAGAVAGGSAAGQAELLRLVLDVFQRPGTVSRWPLYLRQVKQLLRAADEAFDERRFGFSGIVEALRYCQREGVFRLDRDRQGVLRVYPGPVLQRNTQAMGHVATEGADSAAGASSEPSDSGAAPADEQPRQPKPMELFRVTDTDTGTSASARDRDAADTDAGTAATDDAAASDAMIESKAKSASASSAGDTGSDAGAGAETANATRETRESKSAPSSPSAKGGSSRRKKTAPAVAPKATKKTAAAAKPAKPQPRGGAAKAARGRKNAKEKAS
jgi:hypothetical protein